MEIDLENSTENPRGFGGTADPEVETDEEGNEYASDEEEMDYQLLTVRSRKMMFGKGKEKILKLLGTSETPAQGMGKAAAMLMKSLVDSGKQAGREISPDAVAAAGVEVIDDLNELAKANDVFTYESDKDEEKELADAMLWGAKAYGDGMMANGEITPEMQQQAKLQMAEGMGEEAGPQPTPVASGVQQAMQPAQAPQPGMVGSMMGGA